MCTGHYSTPPLTCHHGLEQRPRRHGVQRCWSLTQLRHGESVTVPGMSQVHLGRPCARVWSRTAQDTDAKGEGYYRWRLGPDEELFPLIDFGGLRYVSRRKLWCGLGVMKAVANELDAHLHVRSHSHRTAPLPALGSHSDPAFSLPRYLAGWRYLAA